jgi:hypothetical protein
MKLLDFAKLSAVEQIRTAMPFNRRYHLKVVRLPISPPPLKMGCKGKGMFFLFKIKKRLIRLLV